MIAPATIYALSSGRPPAAIAIVRISGPGAGEALRLLAGAVPLARAARMADLHMPAGELLDRAMVLWFPGPASATGEDVAELHLHGGRAVVDGVLDALAGLPGLRAATPGEFTRRAFANGKIDLNEAEGLADLLTAETRGQRRAALAAAGGAMSRAIEGWRMRLLDLAAGTEALIDFSDEDDVVAVDLETIRGECAALVLELRTLAARPPAERLRDGVRVVIAGPPNAGKSSLLNALCGRDAAIASPTAGTTRDVIEVPIAIAGVPMILTDTAGLGDSTDEIESIGIERAERAIASADVLIWLGKDEPPAHDNVVAVSSRCDVDPAVAGRIPVSVVTDKNIDLLTGQIVERCKRLLPDDDEIALNRRQRDAVEQMASRLSAIASTDDPLIVAEELRSAMAICDRMTGRSGVEDMLDSLFARFCVGK